jgi:hypothetical protein
VLQDLERQRQRCNRHQLSATTARLLDGVTYGHQQLIAFGPISVALGGPVEQMHGCASSGHKGLAMPILLDDDLAPVAKD